MHRPGVQSQQYLKQASSRASITVLWLVPTQIFVKICRRDRDCIESWLQRLYVRPIPRVLGHLVNVTKQAERPRSRRGVVLHAVNL